MKEGPAGATGPNNPSEGMGLTGPDGRSYNKDETNRDEIIKLLKSIDKNIKEINAKLK
jgi:hypothetical protein